MSAPNPIRHTSDRVLEFDHLRELLAVYAASPLGQKRIASLAPSRDRQWIEGQQLLTEELRGYVRSGGRFDFHGMLDPTPLLNKSRIQGAALELTEIRDVLLLADRAAEWREIVLHPPVAIEAKWDAVRELSQNVADFTELLRHFRNKILPDGTLDDRASPELSRIRRDIDRQRHTIQQSLQSYLRRLADGGAVQDELITIRGERFVIPVKVEQRRRVQGVAHGASSSGQTVFMEPLETIEQNNELVRLHDEELGEIHRILLEMTARIGEQAEALTEAVEILGELELQFAKARFAKDYDCVAVKFLGGEAPQVTSASSAEVAQDENGDAFVLRNARHPLLERTLKPRGVAVVPLTVEIDSQHHQVIISGPNTGGKTVALKTIGLMALMAQSGIPLPAERAELPIFDGVFADIGDYQSIEQNLSTFSAHVTNIDFISHHATRDSLVLLDELGSATDPEEGAALAVSIADFFRRAGCLSIVSTHHTALKVYAANAEGVLNAAVGFDERTLAPTFELRIGVPGASAGINIAQQLGLNPQIVAEAREKLTTQTHDVSRFLDRLHEQLREIDTERLALRAREQEIARERSHLAVEGKKEQREKIREMEKKLESVLHNFEYQARETVNAVQDRAQALKLSKDAERRISKMRREFREQFDATVVAHATGSDTGDKHATPHVVQHVSVGDTVRLRSMGRDAKVLRHFDDDSFEVAVGSMKMKVPRDDIASTVMSAGANPVASARSRGIGVSLSREDDSVPTEINVIGQTVDEATRAVEKFVDHAFLAGAVRVRIVHGSGMGILRKALRQFLQEHPHVASVAEPPQNEGGGGATVVELRT
ncbi:MAG TPA: endonuclease MutS2 [Candidatus Limnocylindrales bacterium]|nr:endonuclease MutS2 [Candidatus Limnocylindrales bacterium]